jgi:CBS domain-containing protein
MTGQIDRYVVHADQTIKDAASIINTNHSRCVIVVSASDTVIGVVSNGDIIRALIDDISIRSPVSKLIQSSCKYLHQRDLDAAFALFQHNPGITLVPIVSPDFQLLDTISIHDVLNHLANQHSSSQKV